LPPSRRSAEAGGLAAAWRRRGPAACLLFPFSLIFKALVAARQTFYRVGMLNRERLPVPVVVVGNITVGGTGKTPLVIALVEALRARGWIVGVVSRGYGRTTRGAHLRQVLLVAGLHLRIGHALAHHAVDHLLAARDVGVHRRHLLLDHGAVVLRRGGQGGEQGERGGERERGAVVHGGLLLVKAQPARKTDHAAPTFL